MNCRPTDFDDFSERAYADWCGLELTEEQRQNRALLITVMEGEGFVVNPGSGARSC
jgi:D-alanyl-D-alanine dipeptidase